MNSPDVNVTEIDHIVLRCTDVEKSVAWYTSRLGLEAVRLDEWREGRAPFPSVRVSESMIIDLIEGASSEGRLDHVCLVVEPIDFTALSSTGDFDVIEGPVTRFGARGDGTSLYIRDPEGTTVELRYYPAKD